MSHKHTFVPLEITIELMKAPDDVNVDILKLVNFAVSKGEKIPAKVISACECGAVKERKVKKVK